MDIDDETLNKLYDIGKEFKKYHAVREAYALGVNDSLAAQKKVSDAIQAILRGD